MKNKALTVLYVVLMIAFIYFGLNTNKAQADAVRDIAPYKFGDVPADTGIYKMVYQGCEIFIAVGDKGHAGETYFKEYPKPVSIATGRGCK